MALFRQVTIVGLGLIGGSLGMAIKRRRLAREVIGLGRKRPTLLAARRRGVIDRGETDPKRALRGADLLVIATPVDTIAPFAALFSRWLKPGAFVMDVGSTKAAIVRVAQKEMPDGVAFIGAHPIAGSEKRGLAAASATLFEDAVCVLTPTPRTPSAALSRARRFWRALGSDVITMSPQAHDRLLASTSHLPHALAYCLSRSVEIKPFRRAPPSLLDMTRIAKSDPELWDDILLANRKELLSAMARFERSWRALRSHVRSGRRDALRRFLIQAQTKRLHFDGLDA
ncbi:MAG: prephenate dehydrogenase [Candidatus Omnitrophica bacterium CG11_big_fil_rev_8_21_14_0_20_63_9]|nr:MAG: prephenate dehydrogenase [Candidatus Omnitrophica bacterium CG11_big_fil_rev_8_21_14_0_20_63_9]